ncbi:MAG: carotenoid biosynthesis protein [Bacillota bacterium]|nr:carotenoid biosynthesis protein [Bacillota bacterium]
MTKSSELTMTLLPEKEAGQLRKILLVAVMVHIVTAFCAAWDFPQQIESIVELAGSFCLLIFVCFHGWYRYGLNKMMAFFAITSIISWSTETLSIETGFPFGQYYYTDQLGDKIGQVPVLIFPAYFFIGYLAWTMGNLFMGNTSVGIKKKDLIYIPVVSALIMVMWNVCFDPIMSTIEGNWVWENGGAYFGVPLSNYFGWFLTVYLIYQVFALFLYRFGTCEELTTGKTFWYWIPVLYALQGLPYFLYPFFRSGHTDIYLPISLITLFTMFLIAFLNVLFIKRHLP